MYRSITACALVAGTAGLLLPLLPTTPFVLLALWASARGAPEWHQRIRQHHRFAPTLAAWEQQRAIPSRAKLAALVMMSASLGLLWLSAVPGWLLAMIALLFSAVAAYVLSRPAPKQSGAP
ncbi:MAG: YbaN family protein [Wenzhouxiangellaceae bacterium]